MFTAANGIISTNLVVPSCVQTDPDTRKRAQLLKQMLDSKPPLDSNMISSAENIMKEIQANGIELLDIIGSGKSAFTISASVTTGIKTGTNIVLKLSKTGRPLQRIKNDPLFRSGVNTFRTFQLLRKKDCFQMIAEPMYVLNNCWSFMGYSRTNQKELVLTFVCQKLIPGRWREMPAFHANEWQCYGRLNASFLTEISQSLCFNICSLHENEITVFDIKPSNILLDEKKNQVLADLANSAIFSRINNASHVSPMLRRNTSACNDADS